jgi:hypothetical protein
LFVWLFAALAGHPSLRPVADEDTGPRTEGISYDPLQYSSGNFVQGDEGPCPATGRGKGDPQLSILKNRDLSAPLYPPETIAHLVRDSLPTALGWEFVRTKIHRSEWPTAEVRALNRREARGVTVEGYFLSAVKQSREMCNCGSPQYVDAHLWIAADKPNVTTSKSLKLLRNTSVVAEISPRLLGSDRSLHLNYTANVINRIARSRLRIRVAGWLMWDEDHPETIGKTRACFWEIHPIHKIDVHLPSGWQTLDSLDLTALRR